MKKSKTMIVVFLTPAVLSFLCIFAWPVLRTIYMSFLMWKTSRLTLIVLYICLNVPYTTTFLLNFFGTLPRTFEEAAAIDGCGPMKTFWVIMLPLVQLGIITVSIFNFLAVWNEYFMALIFAGSDELKNVGIGLFNMVSAMKSVGDLGGLFAAVIIVFMPTFLLYIFLSEKIIAGVTAGGVKG